MLIKKKTNPPPFVSTPLAFLMQLKQPAYLH